MKNTQRTRVRIALLAIMVALLLASTAAAAQPDGGYAGQQGTLAGGGYRLTRVSPPAGDTMIGGDYQLFSVTRSTATGSGCCCTFVPCILNTW